MSDIHVFDDHIRFLGYHVPVDTSGLPPSTRASFVSEIQEGVDRPESASSEQIDDAVDDEKSRIIGLVRAHLDYSTPPVGTAEDLADEAAGACAKIIACNLRDIISTQDIAARRELIARWLSHELKAAFQDARASAVQAAGEKLEDFLETLE